MSLGYQSKRARPFSSVDNIIKFISSLGNIPKELEGSQGLRQVITSTNYGLDPMRQWKLQQEAMKQFGANLKSFRIVGANL